MSVRMPASAGCLLFAMALAAGSAHAGEATQPKSAAEVIAADKAWGEAEERGDAKFVQQLLDPDYVSVGPKGKITTRAAIVSHTSTSPEALKARAEQVAKWRSEHPGKQRSEVKIFGDTAVLTWLSPNKDSAEPVHSCDIFVYRDGRWHAIYSQHTTAEG